MIEEIPIEFTTDNVGFGLDFLPAATNGGDNSLPTVGALVATNYLSEYAGNPDAQAQVQTNIGVLTTNLLAHYILAST